jgi:predicted ATPase with chaperone activity
MRTNSSIRRTPVKFKLGQHVRISKEKLKFAKGGEQNDTSEIFRIQKVVSRIPRPVHELVDLLGKHIDWHLYWEELTPVNAPKNRTYPILKILRKRVRNARTEYLVRWAGYTPDIDSWISAIAVKKHGRQQRLRPLLRHC